MNRTPVCYLDPRTGARYSCDELRWRSDSGGPLMLEPLPGIGRDDIDCSTRSLWRYRAALPVDLPEPVSLGEGCTPLIERRWNGQSVLFKLDWVSPTGSFKDKGAAVLVSFLRRLGVEAILEDSSGNGGAAIAAYGAAAKMRVRILAPESTQPAKLAQMRIFGAEVQLVPGGREASEQEAIRQSRELFYAGHNWHPVFLQGTKMTAYEIWEDLDYRAPDNIVVPVGAGSILLGCEIGFSELLAAGQIRHVPRLFGVQPANCAPIVASFAANTDEPVAARHASTIADGAAIRHPVRLREALAAIRLSGGMMVAVEEAQIVPALQDLAAAGLFVEPTSAIVVPALERLLAGGDIRPEETTVVLLSGSGLKAGTYTTELAEAPAAAVV